MSEMSAEPSTQERKTFVTGGVGFLMVLSCLAGPAVIGAIGGTAIGGVLGIAGAVVVAITVAGLLHWRRRKKGSAC